DHPANHPIFPGEMTIAVARQGRCFQPDDQQIGLPFSRVSGSRWEGREIDPVWDDKNRTVNLVSLSDGGCNLLAHTDSDGVMRKITAQLAPAFGMSGMLDEVDDWPGKRLSLRGRQGTPVGAPEKENVRGFGAPIDDRILSFLPRVG